MSDKLTRLDKLNVGLQPDLPDRQKAFWHDGENILFKDKAIMPVPSQIPINSFGHKFSAICSTGTHVFLGLERDVIVWDVENQSSTTLTSGAVTGSGGWHFVAWGSWVIGTQSGKVYKITTGAITLISDAPTGIKFLLKVKSFVLAVSKDTVYWCSDDDVETWTPSETNLAGELFIRDCNSEILAGAALESYALLATKDELIRVNYISRPYVFGYQRLYTGAGAFTDKCLAVLNSSVFGMGTSGAWVSDGESVQFIDRDAISTTVLDEMNLNRTADCLVGVWQTLRFVLFFIPIGTSTKCFAFNLDTSTWTVLTLYRNLQDKEYWTTANGVLYRDDFRFAGVAPTNAGSLPIQEAGFAGTGYGTEPYGFQFYGGNIALDIEELR